MRVRSQSAWRRQSLLLDERDRLTRLHRDLRVASTSRLDYEPHDVTDDEAALQADAIEGRLAALDEALDRIDSGRYGSCETCGTSIAAERLAALPATALCRACAG